jgi:hypothetical protein
MIEVQLVNSAPCVAATAFGSDEERLKKKTHHQCFGNGREVSPLFQGRPTSAYQYGKSRFEHVNAPPLRNFGKRRIFMNAVDTGKKLTKIPELARKQEQDFQPPLDRWCCSSDGSFV